MNSPARIVAEKILRKYPLCDACLGRQFPGERKGIENREKGEGLRGGLAESEGGCYICGCVMSSIDSYAGRVIGALKEYEFGSFLVGAHVSTSITEREDHVRAEYKLKGGETFKADLTRQLGRAVSARLGVDVKYRRPEVTVVIDPVLETVEVRPGSIHLYGRYVKTVRGIHQKQVRCRECEGRGCEACGFTGNLQEDSVERRLTEPLLKIFKGSRVKFTWIGGEDAYSLVLGRGRPFYAEILEPKIRHPENLASALKEIGEGLALSELDLLEEEPRRGRAFTVTVYVKVTLDRPLSRGEAEKLEEAFKNTEVKTVSPDGRKSGVKKIYSLKVKRRRGGELELKIDCEGGLNIKGLITGEGGRVKPSVAESIGRKVTLDEKAPFDILNISFDTFTT